MVANGAQSSRFRCLIEAKVNCHPGPRQDFNLCLPPSPPPSPLLALPSLRPVSTHYDTRSSTLRDLPHPPASPPDSPRRLPFRAPPSRGRCPGGSPPSPVFLPVPHTGSGFGPPRCTPPPPLVPPRETEDVVDDRNRSCSRFVAVRNRNGERRRPTRWRAPCGSFILPNTSAVWTGRRARNRLASLQLVKQSLPSRVRSPTRRTGSYPTWLGGTLVIAHGSHGLAERRARRTARSLPPLR